MSFNSSLSPSLEYGVNVFLICSANASAFFYFLWSICNLPIAVEADGTSVFLDILSLTTPNSQFLFLLLALADIW